MALERVSMSGSADTTSDDINRVWTAAELGLNPVFCPHCGKEKTWRQMFIEGQPLRCVIMCECEVKAEKAENERQKQREQQERIDRIMGMSNLGDRFRDASFDNWVHEELTEPVFKRMFQYADSFSRKTDAGICIYGRPGNGKSHLAAAVVNCVIKRGYTAVFIEAPELFRKIRATYNGDGDEAKIMHWLSVCDLLVLDDAGAEKPSDWVQEKCYQIINDRYKNHKPMILTTNTVDMSGLEDVVGYRAYDRLVEMCVPVKNDGTSYRRKMAVRRLREEQHE